MSRYPRYAVYYAPGPETRWWRFGCQWLGRDAISGKTFEPFPLPRLTSHEIDALTAAPRRYGFHATLKAPFTLAENVNEHDLHRALRDLTLEERPFDLGKLRLCMMDGFLVLRPTAAEATSSLARRCVEQLDFLRATPTDEELTRRRQTTLSARQEDLLQRWGYPYVMEEFRFHMTLTGQLSSTQRDAALDGLSAIIRKLNTEHLAVNALCLFEQAAAGAAFRLTARYGFDGSSTRYAETSARTSGRLFYVVGPSGAGKDTLLDYAKSQLPPPHAIVFAHRYITRPFDAGGENHVALDDREFERRQRAGAFAMTWQTHDCRYGIGIEIDHWLEQGLDVVVNGSRAYLPEAHKRYPRMTVICITADRDVLATRLTGRGRETAENVTQRLARMERFDVPPGVQIVTIANNTALQQAGEELMRVLCAQ